MSLAAVHEACCTEAWRIEALEVIEAVGSSTDLVVLLRSGRYWRLWGRRLSVVSVDLICV
jgi:hypothetical protein